VSAYYSMGYENGVRCNAAVVLLEYGALSHLAYCNRTEYYL